MDLSTTTPIFINLGTILAVIFFAINISSKITKFKENICSKIKNCEDDIISIKNEFYEFKEEEKKHNISERLARIETDIQWIRQALAKKK